MEFASSAYRVHIERFEGPLDLLLHLVREAKLDLTEISLAQVAQQYFAYIQAMPRLDVELESSYLVVFAQLLELKSRLLLPFSDDNDWGGEEAWGDEASGEEEPSDNSLLKKLADYAAIKEAALWLGRREDASLSCFPRPLPMLCAGKPVLDVSLDALVRAMRRLARGSRSPHSAVTVAKIVLSVPERIEQIWQMLSVKPEYRFAELLGSEPTRDLVIVTFLSLLELAKERKITVSQAGTVGEIQIRKVAEHD